MKARPKQPEARLEASRLRPLKCKKNAPLLRGIHGYFFMVPPGDVASPFFSAAPAVPAPCVLESFADGIEVPVVAPLPSFRIIPSLSILSLAAVEPS
jgi:hypothetical protein